MELIRVRSMTGWGLASSCASVSVPMAAGQERAACQQGASLSNLFLQAQGPRTGCCSQGEHGTPQSSGLCSEGQAGGEGWLAQQWQWVLVGPRHPGPKPGV